MAVTIKDVAALAGVSFLLYPEPVKTIPLSVRKQKKSSPGHGAVRI